MGLAIDEERQIRYMLCDYDYDLQYPIAIYGNAGTYNGNDHEPLACSVSLIDLTENDWSLITWLINFYSKCRSDLWVHHFVFVRKSNSMIKWFMNYELFGNLMMSMTYQFFQLEVPYVRYSICCYERYVFLLSISWILISLILQVSK